MRNYKLVKVIILILSIVLVLFLTEFVLVKTMKSIKNGTVGKINSVMEKKLDVELSIWGASTAWVNFNPRMIVDSLALSAFNMGIDGTNIDQYYGLLLNYIGYTKKSKYLIIAIDIHGGLVKRNSFYHMHNWVHHFSDNNIYNAHLDIDKVMMYKYKYVPFYSVLLYDKHAFSHFKSALLNNIGEYSFPKLGYQSKGNVSLNKEKGIGDATKFDVVVDDRVLEKIKTSCQLAAEKGIEPIVVITPCFINGLKRINNIDYYKKKILGLRNGKLKVYDFLNTEMSSQPNFFKDNTHLNSKGADELTLLLIKKLKENQ